MGHWLFNLAFSLLPGTVDNFSFFSLGYGGIRRPMRRFLSGRFAQPQCSSHASFGTGSSALFGFLSGQRRREWRRPSNWRRRCRWTNQQRDEIFWIDDFDHVCRCSALKYPVFERTERKPITTKIKIWLKCSVCFSKLYTWIMMSNGASISPITAFISFLYLHIYIYILKKGFSENLEPICVLYCYFINGKKKKENKWCLVMLSNVSRLTPENWWVICSCSFISSGFFCFLKNSLRRKTKTYILVTTTILFLLSVGYISEGSNWNVKRKGWRLIIYSDKDTYTSCLAETTT